MCQIDQLTYELGRVVICRHLSLFLEIDNDKFTMNEAALGCSECAKALSSIRMPATCLLQYIASGSDFCSDFSSR